MKKIPEAVLPPSPRQSLNNVDAIEVLSHLSGAGPRKCRLYLNMKPNVLESSLQQYEQLNATNLFDLPQGRLKNVRLTNALRIIEDVHQKPLLTIVSKLSHQRAKRIILGKYFAEIKLRVQLVDARKTLDSVQLLKHYTASEIPRILKHLGVRPRDFYIREELCNRHSVTPLSKIKDDEALQGRIDSAVTFAQTVSNKKFSQLVREIKKEREAKHHWSAPSAPAFPKNASLLSAFAK